MAKALCSTNQEIQVPMEVEYYRVHPEDKMVELHGYVGDYSIILCLPSNRPEVRKILDKE